MRVTEPTQRLRLIFAKGEAIKYISHLDLARTWERAFRRAGLPLVYSQGYNPRPKYAFGAALPVGLTSRGEVLDLWLSPPLPPETLVRRLAPQLPGGLVIIQAWEVDLALPSLQSVMQWAEYRVTLRPDPPKAELEQKIAGLLAAESWPRQRLHKDKVRAYDLRPLVAEIRLADAAGKELDIRLANSSEATGRVDELLDALGLAEAALVIERTQLIWRGQS